MIGRQVGACLLLHPDIFREKDLTGSPLHRPQGQVEANLSDPGYPDA